MIGASFYPWSMQKERWNGKRALSTLSFATAKCDHYGLSVIGSHYPPGSSKWNPIEGRLFSEINKNWVERPPDSSHQPTLKYIRTSKT
jgi:hypothetical protein